MFEYFISKRYLRSKHKLSFISIISIISTLGVTIGVAALIIVLSVLNGFGSLVTKTLINFDPHLRISSSQSLNNDLSSVKSFLGNSEKVKSFAKYAEGKIILMNKESTEILNLKGIPINDKASRKRIEDRLIFGEFNLDNSDGIDKIIISLPIALKISARVGDTIYATSASQIKNTITRMSIPQTKKIVVTGIYEISNKEYALEYTFTSFSSAQQILNLKNSFSGIEVVLNNIDDADLLKKELQAICNNCNIYTWYDLHKDLYRVMLIERWAAYILLSLIIAVAVFNILSSLTMSVLEKKKDIGVLRSMGTNSLSIKKIFMFEGILIGVIGTVFGVFIGLFVCFLQIQYNIYPLDASKFIIDSLPIEIRITDIFAVVLMSLILTFFASKYPANKALKLKIIDAIKWE